MSTLIDTEVINWSDLVIYMLVVFVRDANINRYRTNKLIGFDDIYASGIWLLLKKYIIHLIHTKNPTAISNQNVQDDIQIL